MNNASARYIDTMLYVQRSRDISERMHQEEAAISEAQLALDLRQGITDMEKTVAQYRAWLGKFANESNSFHFCDFGSFRIIYNMPANTPANSPIFEENVERYRQDTAWRFRDIERAYDGMDDSQISSKIEGHKKRIDELKAEHERLADEQV